MTSPLVLGLWSIIVEPGKTYPQKIRTPIQITNISFGAEIKGDARSVVTLKYPEFEQEDSDDEDSDEDDEEKVMKDAEEDEDEDDEDGEITLPKLITKEAVLAILKPGGTEQISCNVSLVEDVEIVEFSVSGPNAVHLVGHYIRQEDFDQDPYSDSEFDSDEDSDDEDDEDFDGEDDDESIDSETLEGLLELEGEDDDDEEDDDEERFEEVEEKKSAPASKKRAAVDEDAEDVAAALLADTSATSTLSKNQKKKLAKKLKGADGAAAPAPVAEKKAVPAAKAEEKPEVVKKAAPQTLAGGLVILDAKKGTGAVAKSGKKVSMRYIGKLDSGKIFDSNTKGAPLNFTLGRGEVIKGWDQGILGMAVGGERKLTIPAALAYGKKGTQGIPGNSTLHFDVKLLNVK